MDVRICSALWLLAALGTPATGIAAPPRAIRPAAEEATIPAIPQAEGIPLTLDDARALALGNNRKLQLGRQNVHEKQLAARAASKDYFPKILGIATYLHFNENLGTVLATEGRQLGGATIGPGGGIQIPTINIPSRKITANVVNVDSAFGTVMVAQPITKLIGVSALVDVARADEEIAGAQLEQGTRDLLSGINQAYCGLLAAGQIETVLTLQLQAVEPLLKGKLPAEARLGILELRKGRAEARKQRSEVNDLLNQLIGYPPGTRLVLAEPILPQIMVESADQAAQFAVSNSPQIREAQQIILKAQAGLRGAKMDFLPDVNVVGGWAGQTAADYIQPNFAYVGVMGSYTFWDWGKRRNIKDQREAQIVLARQNVAVMTETVELEARKAFQAYEQAAEELEIAKDVVTTRQDSEGEAKAPAEVMAAKAATARSQLELMQAELNTRMAQAKLAAAIGQ